MSKADTPAVILTEPDPLVFPDGWKLTTSWRRAQTDRAIVSPGSDRTFRVRLGSGDFHRLEFFISGGRVRAGCDCQGFHARGFCAHVAHLWWQWSRDRLVVTDTDTGRNHRLPPTWISVEDRNV